MACRVYEDEFRVEVGLAEAVPLDIGDPPPCYPYPSLVPLIATEVRTVRTLVLENDVLRAVFAPELGGRMLALIDLRTGKDALGLERLPCTSGGPRRCRWHGGLCIDAGWRGSPTEAAAVEAMALSDPDGALVGVRFLDVQAGTGLGVSTVVQLEDGAAAVTYEVRVLNREPRVVPYDMGVRHGLGKAREWSAPGAWVAATPDRGVALLAAPGEFAGWTDGALCRLGTRGWLPPHHQDSVSFSVMPLGGIDEVLAATPRVVVASDSEGLWIRSPERLSAKLVLHTAGGPVEAPVAAEPGVAVHFASPPAHEALALIASDRGVMAGWPLEPGEPPPATPATQHLPALDALACDVLEGKDRGEGLQRLLPVPALRPAAWALLASSQLRNGNAKLAAELLETTLGYSAEDPMLWWAKALAHRLAGDDPDERPELPNAHFLAPQEPLLRAEAFLRGGGSSLVEALAERPEHLVEVACRLIEAGAGGEALKWIEEAEKHSSLPMLDYLAAFVLLRDTELAAEAAAKVAHASQGTWTPPFPWRVVERAALRLLASAFPGDERITNLHRCIERYSDSTSTSR